MLSPRVLPVAIIVVIVVAVAIMATAGIRASTDENRGDTASPTPDTGGAQTPVSGEAVVEVGDDYLDPEELAVTTGTTVIFTWVGEDEHRLASSAIGGLESEHMTSGTYEFTFDEPGNFRVHCTVHGEPVMHTTITVLSE